LTGSSWISCRVSYSLQQKSTTFARVYVAYRQVVVVVLGLHGRVAVETELGAEVRDDTEEAAFVEKALVREVEKVGHACTTERPGQLCWVLVSDPCHSTFRGPRSVEVDNHGASSPAL
jgi:hypothetical protein